MSDKLLPIILTRLNRGDCPDNKWPDNRGEYWPLCPFHNDTHSGSFSISERGYKCFACGASGSLRALAKKLDVTPLHGCMVDAGDNVPPPPLTLEEYAKYKALPVDYLQGLGLQTIYIQGKQCVKIPYYDKSGNETAVRFRQALAKGKRDNRFRWRRRSKPNLYGLWQFEDIRRAGYVLLFEGESDCQTAWYYNLPALGIPGATLWRDEWAQYFEGLKVYLWQEPDQAGEGLTAKVGEALTNLCIIKPPPNIKDISEAHILGENIAELLAQLKAAARLYAEIKQEELNAVALEAKRAAAGLINCPAILDKVSEMVKRLGLVGESINAKLLYLAVTSRLLPRPVNIVIKGPSSAGKSYTIETVLKLFPPSAYYALSSMSERALAYSEEPLKHRFLVLYEAAGLTSDFGTYLIRTLLSEGCIRYETVEKTKDGLKPRLIEREGPVGLLVTTTAVNLHPENETRMFSITTKDDPAQTRAIFQALANRVNGQGPVGIDPSAWHGLQTWLELAGVREVNIPFAPTLAKQANAKAVRLRRDFGGVLTLIAAHAVLHQTQRQRDETGRIIATLADYIAVYELVKDIISEGVQAAVSKKVRETVHVVADITPKPVSIIQVATRLDLDKSAASRRVREAIDLGYLVNLEDKRGKAARLVIGDSLPEEIPILPPPDSLNGEGVPLSIKQPCNTATLNLLEGEL